jgi:metal-responsive CopG/Arc/MetJ family transcriptional regulator
MNDYEFFVSKLKSMQIQGINKNEIIEEWKLGLPNALPYLEQSLVVAVLKGDSEEIKTIKHKIKNIKTLDKTIIKGLLE